MAKIRVYDLAKELGKSSKEVVDMLQIMGLDVKNHMSTMEDSQVNWVKRQLNKKPGDDIKEKTSPTSEKNVTKPQERLNKPVAPGRVEPRNPETPRRPDAPGLNRPQSAPGSNRPQSAPGPNRPQSAPGPNRPQSAPGPNRPQNAPGPNRPQSAPGPNRPQSAPGSNRPPFAPGPNRPSTTPNQQTANRDQGPGRVDRPQTGDRPVRRPENGPGNTNQTQYPQRRTEPANKTGFNNRPPATAGKPPINAAKGGEKTGNNNGPDKNKAKKPFNPQAVKKNTQQQMPRKDYSRPKKSKHKRRKEETVLQTPEVIVIGDLIMVRELADKLAKGSGEIVKKLMELGTMASINQVIDYETAEIVASLYEVKVEREVTREEKILEEIIDADTSLSTRPPVVTVMGHVDHGKTSLLDRIRKADVVSGEAGGITQHIGAYQVKIKDNRITFIDTPGHEAFTSMRARGANLTDIVILVVAADDGVMPQTVEAVNHIKAAKVPFIVAINKMDKPEANPDRIMQQLTEYNIVPEEWGGDTIFVPVSAKSGDGIENLLEVILLVAEVNDIKANFDRTAEGVVIEGELDKGKGAVATVLVQKGTLNVGDFLICGFNLCKVRAMTDHRGRKVDKAFPSMPVEVTGWDEVPEAGMKIQAVDERVAKEIVSLRLTDKKMEEQKQSSRVSLDDFFKQIQDAEVKELALIIKGDVQGSVEALAQALLRLTTNEVKVSVIHSAVGAITETDVMLASASNAIIIGFNVRPDSKARKYAENEQIDVRIYRVIYEAIEDVKRAMVGLLDPEYKEKFVGRAEVKLTFKVPNAGTIAGSYVIDGKIQRNANVRVLRDSIIVYEGKLSSLRRFKDDAKEVMENYECGIGIKDFNDIKEGDIIEAYVLEEVPREL